MGGWGCVGGGEGAVPTEGQFQRHLKLDQLDQCRKSRVTTIRQRSYLTNGDAAKLISRTCLFAPHTETRSFASIILSVIVSVSE